jgi:HSP20 family protein
MSVQDFMFGNAWREFDRLQNEVNALLRGNNRTVATQHGALPLNIWVNDEGAVVSTALPGADPKSIDVSILGETLTLKGIRQARKLKEGETYHRQERSEGTFSRTVQLPFRVDADKVEARYSNGILALQLPRSSEDRPRRISVSAS